MKTNAFIAARPQLHIPGIIDSRVDEVHITLAYLKDVEIDAVFEALNTDLYRGWPTSPILCNVHGSAQWLNNDGAFVSVLLVQPVAKSISRHSIYDERARIESSLLKNKIKLDDTYPFVPHITKEFSDEPMRPATVIAPVMFAIDTLYISHQESDGEGGTRWSNEALMASPSY